MLFGGLEANGSVSMDKPDFALRGATDTVIIGLSGAGQFQLRLDGLVAGGVFIR